MIQKYSTVTVVVSNGSDLVKLSELTLEGMTEETAKVLLEQKKLIVKEEQEYHDTIKEGQVIRYEPSQARPGETVTLYISAGPITVMKTVPDISKDRGGSYLKSVTSRIKSWSGKSRIS